MQQKRRITRQWEVLNRLRKRHAAAEARAAADNARLSDEYQHVTRAFNHLQVGGWRQRGHGWLEWGEGGPAGGTHCSDDCMPAICSHPPALTPSSTPCRPSSVTSRLPTSTALTRCGAVHSRAVAWP